MELSVSTNNGIDIKIKQREIKYIFNPLIINLFFKNGSRNVNGKRIIVFINKSNRTPIRIE